MQELSSLQDIQLIGSIPICMIMILHDL